MELKPTPFILEPINKGSLKGLKFKGWMACDFTSFQQYFSAIRMMVGW